MTVLFADADCRNGRRRGRYDSANASAAAAVVEMMKTVEMVAGRIRGGPQPHAVRRCHGHGRTVRVELVGERGIQFGHGGHDRTAAGYGVHVILTRGHRFVVPVLRLLLLLLLLLMVLLLVVRRLVVIVHVVQ